MAATVSRRAWVTVTLLAALGAIVLAGVLFSEAPLPTSPPRGSHVIVVSVDGLRPDAVAELGPDDLPNFYRLRAEGTFTENARTDFSQTVTLPNHAALLTGRPVDGVAGHGLSANDDLGGAIHGLNSSVSYIASVFDVVHDAGGSTALFASKDKFELFNRTWDGSNGSPDITGEDDGVDKIDDFVFQADGAELLDRFLRNMESDQYWYSLLHLRGADAAGHRRGFMGDSYFDAVRQVDEALGRLMELVEEVPELADNTVIIVTSDHGGTGTSHDMPTLPENYTIPVYLWGAGIPAGDLYRLNSAIRADPGSGRPGPDASLPPIRIGDLANLALSSLGLPPVPGSVHNPNQELTVAAMAGR